MSEIDDIVALKQEELNSTDSGYQKVVPNK